MLFTLLAVASITVGVAWAHSSGAHFQKNSVRAAVQSNGDLAVSWVEAGLGNLNINYTLTGDVTAQYFCRTNSGSIPNANNKQTHQASDSAGGSFEPKNGKVTGSLTLVPPVPASGPPTCGNGQSLDLQSVIWSNVVLTDTSNSLTANVTAGTFSITLFPAP